MKKNYLLVILLTVCMLTGCGIKKDEISKEQSLVNSKEQNSDSTQNEIPSFQVDLTHDGIFEEVTIDVKEARKENQAPISIEVKNSKKETLWKKEVFLSHLGQESYFIYSHEGKDYLLYYLPSDSQGISAYSYRLFYINEEGKELVEDKGELIFQRDESKEVKLPIEKMLAFADKVNGYMSKSYLLVSTLDGELQYSVDDKKQKYVERYQKFLNGDEQRNVKFGLQSYVERINEKVID